MPKKKKIHEHVKDTVVNWDERMKKYRFYKEMVRDALLMLPLIGSFGGGAIRWLHNAFVTYSEKSVEAAERVARSARSAGEGLRSGAPITDSAPVATDGNWVYSMLEWGWFLCIVLLIAVLSWRAWKLIVRLVKKLKNGKQED